MTDISEVITKYGLPLIMTVITIIGSTITIKYIWTWVNIIITPTVSDTNMIMIKTLNDRIHMLDDNIKLLQHKVNTILSIYDQTDNIDEIESVIDETQE